MVNFKELFEPESIAIVGASPNPKKVGFFLLKSILQHEYSGKIYPVNPNYKQILGLKCYPSLIDVPDNIELVIYVIPNNLIIKNLQECEMKNVKAILVISGGFRESGSQGTKLENELAKFCRERNITLLGPNSTGFINATKKLFATINYFDTWFDGNIAIAGQTGIFAGAYLDEIMSFHTQRIGIAKSVSLGNRADFDECNFLEYVWKDENIKVIMLYLESIKRPRNFFDLARKVKKDKPIILFKAGKTELGIKAAISHTGSLAQPYQLIEGAASQCGIIMVNDIEEFFDIAKGFSYQSSPKGPRIGVITMSGANMTMVADEIATTRLVLTKFSNQTLEVFRRYLPSWQNVSNPADIGLALTEGYEVREKCLKAALADDNIDVVLFIDLAVKNSDFDGVRELYKSVLETAIDKPFFLVLQGGETKKKWLREIEGLNIPVYPTVRRAIRVIDAMYFYQQIKDK